MTKLSLLLTKVHDSVHDSEKMKLQKTYSEPKLYTGGIDIKKWNKLSQKQKKEALSKQWYIRWSYRNPKNGKLERQINLKAGNRYKTKKERMEILNAVRENLSRLLKEGQLNPYDDEIKNNETLSVEEAFKFALSQKAKTLAETSFGNYKNRIKNFEKYLLQNGFKNRFITSVTKKDVNKYLNDVLQKTSASNRNNSRTDISSLFTTLSNEDIIPVNFIHKIPVLKSNPEKNTAFNQEEVKAIFEKAKKEDVWLYYFISHIYYGLFRNVEIVRIQIADINIKEKKIKSNTKTGNFYKQIPQILIDEFYTNLDLSKYPKDYFLFTKDNEPSQWLTRPNKETGKRSITEEINRRGYWGKRFNKIIKEPMGFAKDYTSYSFRHSAIGKMFIEKVKELRKEGTPDFEDKALDFIRKITAHKDNDTVRNYLREIGYYKIDDWSNLLK